MKISPTPVRSTMVWGLFSGLVYIPLSIPFGLMLPWPLSLQLLLWALLAGYGVLLSRWASKPLVSIALPLVLLLLAAFLIQSPTAFLFTALGILSWMRSGICFKQSPLIKRLAVEIILGVGAGLSVSAAVPTLTLAGALGVWLFFLVQTLYFVVFDYRFFGPIVRR